MRHGQGAAPLTSVDRILMTLRPRHFQVAGNSGKNRLMTNQFVQNDFAPAQAPHLQTIALPVKGGPVLTHDAAS